MRDCLAEAELVVGDGERDDDIPRHGAFARLRASSSATAHRPLVLLGLNFRGPARRGVVPPEAEPVLVHGNPDGLCFEYFCKVAVRVDTSLFLQSEWGAACDLVHAARPV